MKVLYFGVHDERYPRNSAVRSALATSGHSVRILMVGSGSFPRKFLSLLIRGLRERPDVIVASEFTQQFASAAWLVARLNRAKLAVDFFVGLYETRVEDHEATSPRSLRGRALWALDWLAIHLADFAFTDTAVRANSIGRRYGARSILPVAAGAPSWATMLPFPTANATRLLYYGNYIPLHGLPVLVDALSMIKDPQRFEITFVGGSLKERRQLEASLRRSGVGTPWRILPPCPEEDLPGLIAETDVVMGVFGKSLKAREVVANKVWQGLLCGRIVITQRSSALADISQIVDSQLIQVAPNDARETAAAIESVSRLPYFRQNRGSVIENGRQLRHLVDVEYARLVSELESLTQGCNL